MIVLPSSAGIFRPFAGATAWTPSSLPLLAWYSADSGVLDASDNPITVDSTAVKTWQDQSGNGRHLVQNTSASRPVFRTVANSFSSLPALEASGSQFFENTALSLGSDVSVYVVCKFVGTPTAFTGVFQLGSNHAHLIFNDNTQHFRIQGGSPTTDVVSGAAATNTRQVLKMDLATTVFRFKQSADGIDSATNTTTISLGTGYKLFQNYIGTATCQISEFILCSRVLTSGEEASLNNYLKTRYAVDTNAIYFTLPTSGAALWLDGSRLDSLYTTDTGSTNVTTNAGAIGRWEDLSGNARHAKQATAGSRPTWVSPTFGQNGLAGIRAQTDKRLKFDTQMSLSGDFTMFGVIKNSSNLLAWMDSVDSTSIESKLYTPFYYSGWSGWATYLKSGSAPNLNNTSFTGPSILVFTRSGTSGKFSIDATDYTATYNTNAALIDYPLGGVQNNLSVDFNTFEQIIYTKALSSTEISTVKTYLKNKWGTP